MEDKVKFLLSVLMMILKYLPGNLIKNKRNTNLNYAIIFFITTLEDEQQCHLVSYVYFRNMFSIIFSL